MPAHLLFDRIAGQHDPHQDHRDYGSRRGKAIVQRQLGRCAGDDPYLGAHLPWVRPDRLVDGKTLYLDVLKKYFA